MELLVTLTLSDKLFTLLEDKLPNLGRRVERAITKELGAQARKESNVAISVNAGAPEAAEADKPRRARRTKTDAPEEGEPATPVEEAPETPQAVEETVPRQEAAAPVVAPQSEKTMGELIREIIHRTRQRFEGEDYKENTTSEQYKKYHRALTDQFKQIAIALGYEKPSFINLPEKVEAFAAECDALSLDEKGVIVPPQAPY